MHPVFKYLLFIVAIPFLLLAYLIVVMLWVLSTVTGFGLLRSYWQKKEDERDMLTRVGKKVRAIRCHGDNYDRSRAGGYS